MQKTFLVKEVKTVTTGVGKNGKVWTLYSVIAEDNSRYSTFEGKYQAMVGKEITIEVVSEPSKKINPNTQKPYVNMSIVENKVVPKNLEKEIDELKKRMERLENFTGYSKHLLTPNKVEPGLDDELGIPF